MLNVIWKVKVKCKSALSGKGVSSFTIIEPVCSSYDEFEVYLIKKFGKERVIEFKRISGENDEI